MVSLLHTLWCAMPVCVFVSCSLHHLLVNGTRHQGELREVRLQVPLPAPASGNQLPDMQLQAPPLQAMVHLVERKTDGMKHQRQTEVNFAQKYVCH